MTLQAAMPVIASGAGRRLERVEKILGRQSAWDSGGDERSPHHQGGRRQLDWPKRRSAGSRLRHGIDTARPSTVANHAVMQALDGLGSGSREQEPKHAVKQTSHASGDHSRSEAERNAHVLDVALTDSRGVLGERNVRHSLSPSDRLKASSLCLATATSFAFSGALWLRGAIYFYKRRRL
jgi:hypothetical protein